MIPSVAYSAFTSDWKKGSEEKTKGKEEGKEKGRDKEEVKCLGTTYT